MKSRKRETVGTRKKKEKNIKNEYEDEIQKWWRKKGKRIGEE